MFSNTLHPLVTSLFRWQFNMSYLTAGTLALLLVVAPMFAAFHWFTYFSKSGANMTTLMIMLFAAYIYRCIFTVGNYFFKTDEWGKQAHSLHNLIGYWVAIGSPFQILPAAQLALFFIFFLGAGIYVMSLVLFRVGKFGLLKGLAPDTILNSFD